MKKSIYPGLAEAMVSQGVSVLDLANELGISYAALRSKIIGESDFRLSEALTIARRFNGSVENLFNDAGDGKESNR